MRITRHSSVFEMGETGWRALDSDVNRDQIVWKKSGWPDTVWSKKFGSCNSDANLALVFDMIESQKDRMFPACYDYITPSGKVSKKKLFGTVIPRVDRMLQDKGKTKTALEMTGLGIQVEEETGHRAAHANVGLVVPDVSGRTQGREDGRNQGREEGLAEGRAVRTSRSEVGF